MADQHVQQLKDEPGWKLDKQKLRMDLLPPEAVEAIAEVFTYGANKYEDRNWEKGMSWGRIYGAMLRHLLAFWRGEDYDSESGKLHLAHAATDALFLLQYYLKQIGKDDRPNGN